MPTKFLEPGGDATFNTAITTTGGFWKTTTGFPGVSTIQVHGNHIKSISYGTGNNSVLQTPNGVLADSGSRISWYIYLSGLPTTSSARILQILTTGGGSNVVGLYLTTGGVLQLWNGTSAQIGTDGSTLSPGIWYRISLAYTITSTTVNRFELFKNGISDISITNATITTIVSSVAGFGNRDANSGMDSYTSDHYIDDSSSLTDTGDIWVTAKRPNANGTINGFTTQIGSGGSGYGSGNSPQVNERALSTTNGWSMVGVGSAVTEEYNIEGKSIGDIVILSGHKIIDYMGWVYASALVSETAQIIVNGVNSNISLTSTNTMFTSFSGSATYPAGAGTDIGIITATNLTTVSLYECGIIVAFIPIQVGSMLAMFQ